MWYVLLLVTTIGAYADIAKPEAVIGIDIGATNSYAVAYKDGKIQVIVKEQGLHTTQSNVALVEERHVDDATEEHAIKNPENAAFKDEKRLEKNWEEATDPKCTKNKCHGSIDVELTLEVTTIVKKMKKDIETNIGEVSHAVVTVPTYFNDAQRKSAKEACEIAGLNVLRVINDPTAAVIAHGFDKTERERNVMVFAMGSTRFDVSILNIDNGIIDTLATSGDTRLGGDAFDQRVMEHFTNQLIEIEPNVKSDDEAINKLRKEVEEAKIKLSTDYLAKIEVNSLITGEDFSVILTRHKFEELNKDLFESTLVAVENALKEAEMSKEEIDDVILVGGSTKIPKIQQLLKEFFGKEPSRSIEPDVIVAIGAAIYADKVSKEPEPPVYISMNPLTIGVETAGRIMTPMIQRNTITPTKKKQTFSNAHDNQMTMTIKVYEGERFSTIDNHLLGKFELVIPPGPKNKREVEVILEIDANEVLFVTAEDKHTGVKETMVIENNRERWTKEYIERMLADGEKFKLDDVKAKERVTNTNELLIEGHYDVEFKERDKDTITVAKGTMDEL